MVKDIKDFNGKNYSVHMTCSKQTRHEIRTDCKKIFLDKNPDLDDASDGIMLNALKNFYKAHRGEYP